MAIDLGYYSPDQPQTLNLKNGVLGDVHVVYDGAPVPTFAYAVINVSGHSAFNGTIDSGALGESLTVNIADKSVLTNNGHIYTFGSEFGAKVDFLGGKGSALVNNGTIDAVTGGASKVDVDVSGRGAWQIAHDVSEMGSFATPLSSTLEFGRSVGSHQSVSFSGEATPLTPETLLLDRPAQFQAIVDGFGANDTIELAHTRITAGSLSHHGFADELKLFAGKHEVADLKLGAHYDPGQFDVTRAGGASFIQFDATSAAHQIVNAGSMTRSAKSPIWIRRSVIFSRLLKIGSGVAVCRDSLIWA
jgi:hypothetical protein